MVIGTRAKMHGMSLNRLISGFTLLCCGLLVLVFSYAGRQDTIKAMNGKGELPPVSFYHPKTHVSALPHLMNLTMTEHLRHMRGYDILNANAPQYLPNFKSPCWQAQTGAHATDAFCLPYFFVAGFPKCGTTDIFEKLQAHPQVLHGKKELHWWTTHLLGNQENIFNYADHFAKQKQVMVEKCSQTETCRYIIGDGSPSTIYRNNYWRNHPANKGLDEPKVLVAHLVHHYLPGAKFIISVRDPVERLYSNFYFQGGRSPEEFDNRAHLSVRLFQECLALHSIRWCAYWNKHDDLLKTSRLRYGLFTIFLEDYLTVYPRQNFHILTYDDYKRNDTAELLKMFQFLELDVPSPEYFENVKTYSIANAYRNKKQPMMNKTRTLLQQFYKPFNDELLARLGLPLDYWGY